MFTLNNDKEVKLQQLVEKNKAVMVENEIKQNESCSKWKAQFDQVYSNQHKRIKGMSAMGQIQYSDHRVKEETLSQMKKDAIYQNAINNYELSASRGRESETSESVTVIEQIYCVPNCVKKHEHKFLYDYSKTWKNPIKERPGECHNQDQPAYMVKGSPINLESNIPIMDDFKDDGFGFNYENIDPKASYKFNQVIESYSFPLKKVKKPNNTHSSFNWMNTATIGLFDKHIPRADFNGAQFHFHSPSEHSIDGKLMDLEMHIVHFIDDKVSPSKLGSENENASQFFAGVLGLLFKVMPDSYFEERRTQNPNILFHDNFLMKLVDEQHHKKLLLAEMDMEDEWEPNCGEDWSPQVKNLSLSPLNLCKFVELCEYNRRFTYQGSLTTAPLVEGILWNVVETVIPITQHTMDQYVNYRKVQEQISTNYIVSAVRKNDIDNFLKAKIKFPEVVKCQYHEGNQFMRVAMCNRRVQDANERPVYHIDCKKK